MKQPSVKLNKIRLIALPRASRSAMRCYLGQRQRSHLNIFKFHSFIYDNILTKINP